MPKAGSKKCSKCGGFFDPRGIKRHKAGCKGILDKMRERGWKKKAAKKTKKPAKAAKKKAAKKAAKKTKKEKEFLVAAFDYDDVRVVKEKGLDEAIDDLLENDVPRDEVEVFEIARTLKVDQIINIKRKFVLKEV
jgi:predicted  nucleic acid-binding Zn-ribbon protein